jgi:hypothetical protein
VSNEEFYQTLEAAASNYARQRDMANAYIATRAGLEQVYIYMQQHPDRVPARLWDLLVDTLHAAGVNGLEKHARKLDGAG